MGTWKDRVQYRFDDFIAKGYKAQFALLFTTVFLIIIICGLIAGIASPGFSVGSATWQSLLHILDQSAIGGDDFGDLGYFIVMGVVTVCGMTFMGSLIGIIDNAMSNKLNDLKKGHSKIIEDNHVVILGFNENINTILSELEQSNENSKDSRTIIVIDQMDNEKMMHLVKERSRMSLSDEIKVKKKSRVIYRSGNIVSKNTYAIAAVENARAIIINKEDDFETIRTILALMTYLKQHELYMTEKMPTIVTLMHDESDASAAAIAAGVYHKKDNEKRKEYEDKIRILYFNKILAHIFAQVCRQPGLSWVLSEIFDYDNSEIYIEKFSETQEKEICGKTFREVCDALENSIGIGIRRNNKVILNPNPNSEKSRFRQGDELIHLANDDMELKFNFAKKKIIGESVYNKHVEGDYYRFLILGWDSSVPDILSDINDYVESGSTAVILSDQNVPENIPFGKSKKGKKVKLKVSSESVNPYNWEEVEAYLETCKDFPTNIVIMCQDDVSKVDADEKVAVLLLKLRVYLEEKGLYDKVIITTEMRLPEDQILLAHSSDNDFIVGSEMANKMMVQVANTPDLFKVFKELLSDEKSEIYLRGFDEYVNTNKPFNFRCVQKSAFDRADKDNEKNKQEIALGWIRMGDKNTQTEVCLNPTGDLRDKEFRLKADGNDSIDNYRLVVLAYD